MRLRCLALTLALCAVPVSAGDDFGLLHITNANVEISSKSTLQIHTRLRSYHDSRQFYQFRAGPIYMHAISPRVLGLAGYYYTTQDNGSSRANAVIHRVWAGGSSGCWRPNAGRSMRGIWPNGLSFQDSTTTRE